MKVLSIMPAYYPALEMGGPITSVHNLNKSLASIGNNIYVITTNAALGNKVKSNEWLLVDDIRIIYTRYFGAKNFSFSPRFIIEIHRIMKSVDILHINGIWNFPILISIIYSLYYNKPAIISPRGALYQESVMAKKGKLKSFYFFSILKPLLKSAALIHFTSEFDKERFYSYTGLKNDSFIIPNGIKLSEYDIHLNNFEPISVVRNKKYVCFLGRINHIKGIELLIKAFNKLSDEFSEFHLVLAGPTEETYQSELSELISDLGLSQKIIFTGFLVQKEIISLLKFSEMMVLPSRSENFGNVVLEALACKVPVVVSNKVGIYKEIERSKSGLICELTPESIYVCMKEIINNQVLTNTLIKNGYVLVKERYSLDNTVQEFIKVYEKLIKKWI